MAGGQYITAAEARSAISNIDDVYKVDGVFTQTLLDIDIENCEGKVDSKVAVRYNLPVTGAVALSLVRGWVISLLRAKAYGHLATSETPSIVISEFIAANNELTAVGRGELRLGDMVETTTRGIVQHFHQESNDVELSREKLKNY